MVEHFSYLTYFHLVKSTSQEETLSGKLAFARWSATFGAKINRYNSYNGRFSEHNFVSAIEDSNKAITFCGVGSHHQKAIDSTCKNILYRGNTYNVMDLCSYFL